MRLPRKDGINAVLLPGTSHLNQEYAVPFMLRRCDVKLFDLVAKGLDFRISVATDHSLVALFCSDYYGVEWQYLLPVRHMLLDEWNE
jgi:hypothetical protein